MTATQTVPGSSSPGRAPHNPVAPEARPEANPPPGTAPAPPPDPRLPAIYRSAAQAIRRRGWAQGASLDANTGGICASYALHLAAPLDHLLLVAATSWLRTELLGGLKVPFWNDYRCTTPDDVTALLDRAADLAERSP
jgi:hypothetical protein